MEEQELTEKQQKVLQYIEEYQMEYGSSPTIREMREYLGVSSDNSVLKHIRALEEKGFLQKDHTPRGIKLLDVVKERLLEPVIKLPLVGEIPAGGPVVCEENTDAWISVAENLVQYPQDSFLLKVRGESMIDAGIHDGDTVIVHQTQHPHNGDIVVALVDGMNTLKRYIFNGEKAYLKAENPHYTDIYPVKELRIQGIVTGLFRSY